MDLQIILRLLSLLRFVMNGGVSGNLIDPALHDIELAKRLWSFGTSRELVSCE